MIRVLSLIKGLGLGGAEMLLANAVPHLDRGRFDYEVAYLLPESDQLAGAFREAGIPVHCLGARSAADGRWIARLRRLLRARRFDVVHAHSPYPAAPARLLVRALGGRRPRLCYTEHNVWARYHPATRWANAATYGLNDHVFAVSGAVRRSVRYPLALRRLRVPPIEVLHEGIDVARVAGRAPDPAWRGGLGIQDSAPVVGTVSNLKAHKGLRHLLDAAALVRRTVPGIHFVIVGAGPEEAALRRRVRDLGLEGVVALAGWRRDAPDLVCGFDVFALASLHEGLPIALLEAMALGVPVVATSVGGTPEVVEDGVQGFLVPPGDPRALAQRIELLLGDPRLRDRAGAAARERARAFDVRRAVRRREEVYARLAGR